MKVQDLIDKLMEIDNKELIVEVPTLTSDNYGMEVSEVDIGLDRVLILS